MSMNSGTGSAYNDKDAVVDLQWFTVCTVVDLTEHDFLIHPVCRHVCIVAIGHHLAMHLTACHVFITGSERCDGSSSTAAA